MCGFSADTFSGSVPVVAGLSMHFPLHHWKVYVMQIVIVDNVSYLISLQF